MSTTNNDILQSLRHMARERAKGELESIGHAKYWTNDKDREKMQKFFDLKREFVKKVEDEGLIEGV